jgi:hypothetical protein
MNLILQTSCHKHFIEAGSERANRPANCKKSC